MNKIHNFSAGPSILPKEAIEESIEGLRNFKGTGLSVVEMSHRTKPWEDTMEEMKHLVKKLLNIPSHFEVFFLGGGASLQFTMIPQNLLPEGGSAAYLRTGTWAANATKEAQFWGNVKIVGDSEDKNFSYIPKGYEIPSDAAYFHITTNNTIFGTQMQEIPKSPIPIVADMSSDIFSKPIDPSQYGVIYAGAQKNMGPAGVTLMIVNPEMLGKSGRKIPSMLDYQVHIKGESMYNTPPVFPIYLSYLTLKWLDKNGGVSAIQKVNEEKGRTIYSEIDRNPLFYGTTATEDRSLMNVTFRGIDENVEKAFFKFAEERLIIGLKGHRSVGGFRASTYNALPLESVQFLVESMQEFEKSYSA